MIDKITLLISDSMIKRNPDTINFLRSMTENRANVEVLFTWSHCKIYIMETHHGDFYGLEGSGNASENAHYEQYLFYNSENWYNMRKWLFRESNIRERWNN
jgi:hypothetical protein